MHIALTGASGFIGQKLLAELLKKGHSLRILQHRSRINQNNTDNCTEIISGDINDPDKMESFLNGCDALIHCAALVAAKTKSDFYNVNVQGTKTIGLAAAKNNIRNTIILSSLAAREPQLSAYANSKAAAEKELSHIDGITPVILRPPAVFGPGDIQMLPLLKLIKKGIAPLPAGEKARISAIYVDDLVNAILAVLQAKTPLPTTPMETRGFEKNGLSWRETLDIISEALGTKPPRFVPPRPLIRTMAACGTTVAKLTKTMPFLTQDKINEICHPDWVCHDHALEKSTTWQPSTDFKTGIIKTITWYRQKNML